MKAGIYKRTNTNVTHDKIVFEIVAGFFVYSIHWYQVCVRVRMVRSHGKVSFRRLTFILLDGVAMCIEGNAVSRVCFHTLRNPLAR